MDFAATENNAMSARVPESGPLCTLARGALRIAQEWLAPVLDLGMRLFVAEAFLTSGLTKIASWDTTVALFENEYQVPLLPPEIAAYLGTAAELTLPVFIALGLGGRLAAIALFVFNIVAVIAYPDLSPAGLKDHQLWGLILLVVALHGPGKLSVDHFIRRRFFA
jgi:putative oxidoreductase